MSRILLVDDDPSVLSSLRRLLRLAPCRSGERSFELEVVTCNTPLQALERLASEDFDLILSDYRMPEMDGIEFLKASLKLQPDAARLILSGYADLNVLARAINEVGIERFVAKPWHDYELLTALGQALAQRALRLENRQLANLVRLEMGDLPDHGQPPATTAAAGTRWSEDGSLLTVDGR